MKSKIKKVKQITRTLLFNIPKHSLIYEEISDGSSYARFDHIDGAYSYCVTEKGGILHLSAITPLEQIGDRSDPMCYRIKEPLPTKQSKRESK